MNRQPITEYTQHYFNIASHCRHSFRYHAALFFMILIITVLSAFSAPLQVHAAQPKLSKTKVYMPYGTSLRLQVKNAGNKKITWSSSKPAAVTVSKTGKLKGVKPGKAVITATVGKKKLTCKVYVQYITFGCEAIVAGKKAKLTLPVASRYLTDPVTYQSSDPKIVSVNAHGMITAKKKGTVTITASSGKNKAAITVRVKNMKLNNTTLSMMAGDTQDLLLSGASRMPVFSSSDTFVAGVSETGKVTAVNPGSAVITASLDGVSYTCQITVHGDRWAQLLDKYRSNTSVNQLLFVKYTGGTYAIAELYNKNGTEWNEVLSCSANVGKNGIGKQVEGDNRTPTGEYTLTSGFGIADNPGALQPYVKVNPNLYWCGDSHYYNQLIDIREKPHNCQGEHLIDYTTSYRYGMFLDYNSSNTYLKGSAIFLHCFGSNNYTAGCIAVSEYNMIHILQTAQPGAKICIYPM